MNIAWFTLLSKLSWLLSNVVIIIEFEEINRLFLLKFAGQQHCSTLPHWIKEMIMTKPKKAVAIFTIGNDGYKKRNRPTRLTQK